jgi:hypothetical protein
MSELSNIVTKEKFINAFRICKEYCEKTDNIIDVNFRLLKDHFINLSETQIASFYEKFIINELIYGLPELHSCEGVTIPKKSTGVREYKFFPAFSMILYNAVGLVFVDTCNEVVKNIKFNRKNIYPFYPTKFILNSNTNDESLRWKVKNDYKSEFKKYQVALDELIIPNSAVLQLDLTQYFETIVHEKLISLLFTYSNQSTLSKNKLDAKSETILEFYFEALMNKRFSIPQGRKNFVSDYFGYLYLVPFDMNIESLCAGFDLKFSGMIRYVDDITIILENINNLSNEDVFRTLLEIESKIINWFLNNLGLTINSSKTDRKIILNEFQKNEFIEENKKSISGIELKSENESEDDIDNDNKKPLKSLTEVYYEFKNVLSKFKFPSDPKYKIAINKDEREILKMILSNKSLQGYVLKKENKTEIIEILKKIDLELIVDYINILIVLFYLKDKKGIYPFKKFIENYIAKGVKLNDKRRIHIIHILLAQKDIDNTEILALINQNKEYLLKDNYGKYLLYFTEHYNLEEKYDTFSDNAIYYRLGHEKIVKDPFRKNYLYNKHSVYQSIIKYFIQNHTDDKAISDQLKHYVIYRRQKKWDLAFNHFHNLFHQIAKKTYSLNDQSSIKDIIEKAEVLNLEEQLDLDKFYNRRNFNMISHPSQKEQPAEKVSLKDLEYFENKIYEIIHKILSYENKPTTPAR